MEAGDKDGRRLHVNGHAPDPAQILLQLLVVLPHPPVGGVNRAGPVIAPVIANGGGDRLLQAEGWQGRHLRGKIIVGGSFPADGGDRQNEVADFVLLLQPAALSQEQACLGLDGAQQVHDRGGAGAAHAEVDDADAVGGGIEHRPVLAPHRHVVPLGEEADIVAEIDQEDVLPELLQRRARVARQPVGHNVVLGLHGLKSETR